MFNAAERQKADGFVRQMGIAVVDDHLPLVEAGIPTVDLVDFEYPYWHTLDDTPDKCSPRSLGQVGRTLLDLLRHEETAP
jgi:glutaminyl-peptide cyclotransferase